MKFAILTVLALIHSATALSFIKAMIERNQTALNNALAEKVDQIFSDQPDFDAKAAYAQLTTILGPGQSLSKEILTNSLAGSNDCKVHEVVNTFQRKYYEQFMDRNASQVYESYVKTYRPSELGRGNLNQMPLKAFASLGDTHLIKRFSEHAAMSYCFNSTVLNNMTGKNLRFGDITVLKTGIDYKQRMNYYATYNNMTRILTFVFRGSTNQQDDLLDLINVPKPFNYTTMPIKALENNPAALVHTGFWSKFSLEQAEVTKALNESLSFVKRNAGNGSIDVVVVGHSLGAAWSILQAADWASRGYPISALYTFGQPRVGNEVTINAMSDIIGNDKYIRVVNANDLIPHLGFAGALHPVAATEYWIPVPEMVGDSHADPRKCNGGQDASCSLSLPCMKWNWHHHAELGDFSQRSDFCRINRPAPADIYK